VLARLGDHDEAIRCFERALEIDAEYDLSWNNLGTALEEQGRLTEADRAYSRALQITPHRPTYHVNRASVLARSGRAEEAVEHLSRAIDLAPEIRNVLPGFQEFDSLLQHPRLRGRHE
jgi:tetratricopeptide (TPR) repeat protein